MDAAENGAGKAPSPSPQPSLNNPASITSEGPYCRKCGTLAVNGGRFCGSCGADRSSGSMDGSEQARTGSDSGSTVLHFPSGESLTQAPSLTSRGENPSQNRIGGEPRKNEEQARLDRPIARDQRTALESELDFCRRCGRSLSAGDAICGGCGLPHLTGRAPSASVSQPSVQTTAGPPPTAAIPRLTLDARQPADGPIIGALLAAMAIATVAVVVGFILMVVVYNMFVDTSARTTYSGAEMAGALLAVVALLVASVFLQVWLVVRFLQKWAGFTIGHGDVFGITIAATIAQWVTTPILGPLAIAVGVAVAWWLVKNRAKPIDG
jgi:RNA polymerase subunit RPABC4/transcription elongation factor Spt4